MQLRYPMIRKPFSFEDFESKVQQYLLKQSQLSQPPRQSTKELAPVGSQLPSRFGALLDLTLVSRANRSDLSRLWFS
jgi:hypothetical protein